VTLNGIRSLRAYAWTVAVLTPKAFATALEVAVLLAAIFTPFTVLTVLTVL
jgi:hypothetical protein